MTFDKEWSIDSRYVTNLTINEISFNTIDNTSTIEYSAGVTKTSGDGFFTTNNNGITHDIWINGVNIISTSTAYDFRGGSPLYQEFFTGTLVIPHNEDGTKTISCSYWARDNVNGLGDGAAIGDVPLTDLDRNPPANVSFVLTERTQTSLTFQGSSTDVLDFAEYSINNGEWIGTTLFAYIDDLNPATVYNIRFRVRKESNQVYGIFDAGEIETYPNTVYVNNFEVTSIKSNRIDFKFESTDPENTDTTVFILADKNYNEITRTPDFSPPQYSGFHSSLSPKTTYQIRIGIRTRLSYVWTSSGWFPVTTAPNTVTIESYTITDIRTNSVKITQIASSPEDVENYHFSIWKDGVVVDTYIGKENNHTFIKLESSTEYVVKMNIETKVSNELTTEISDTFTTTPDRDFCKLIFEDGTSVYKKMYAISSNNIKSNSDIIEAYSQEGITTIVDGNGFLEITKNNSNANFVARFMTGLDTDIEDYFLDGDTFKITFIMKSNDTILNPDVYIKSGMGYYPMVGNMNSEFSEISYTGLWKKENKIAINLGFKDIKNATVILKSMTIEKKIKKEIKRSKTYLIS